MAANAPDAGELAALRQLALVRTHGGLVTLLLQSIFYGMFVALAWEYYRRFRRRNDERLFLQVCVAVLLVLSTAFFALCAAIVYEDISQLVARGGTLDLRPSIAQTVVPFLLTIFSAVAEVYWVYRAVQVAQNWFSRALAAGLWILSLGAFSGHCWVFVRLRSGESFSPHHLLIFIFVGTWLFLADSFFCAGVLVYELVYKRRNELAKSSLVQQFTALALKTSLIIVVFVMVGAIATTHAYVYDGLVSGQIAVSMGNLFPFASCCCVAVSLLQRSTLRNEYAQPTSLHPASKFGGPSYVYPPASSQLFGHRSITASFGHIDFAHGGESKSSTSAEEKRGVARLGYPPVATSRADAALHVWLPRGDSAADDLEAQQTQRNNSLRPFDLARSRSLSSVRTGGGATPAGVTVSVEVERSVDDGEEGRVADAGDCRGKE